ncbi:hypothetical protein BD324DRAFT_633393 [Kockovaella imperatae]|uniref:Uncharacterized protein n=1 Tax=Kockovaella imperatae TaxID=4999 RepID=A0A1Y1UAB4_9TREE|nr:hypothetical protein BD324DRAFT_633393 [Kockovaella imperatae]ORX34959.1 hypothetical protein BD324DRAFT_633393 [Kockovaella imperatae]
MVQIEVDHPRHPVFLYSVGRFQDVSPTIFPITVTLSSKERTKIGGVRAAWQTTIQHPLSGRSFHYVMEWGKAEVLETIITSVLDGNLQLEPGVKKTCTFTLSIPHSLPPSCTTDFEKVTHTLFISALPPAPEYTDSATYVSPPSSINGESRGSFFSFRSKGKRAVSPSPVRLPSNDAASNPKEASLPPTLSPNLAIFRKDIRVVTPLCPKDVPPTEEYDSEKLLPGIGTFRYMFATGICTVGTASFLCCRLNDLNPLVTIYSVNVCLEQRVTSVDEQETHVDKWTMGGWECAADKKERMAYLWRGPEAKAYAGQDFEEQGHSGCTRDEIHLNGLPRTPSATLNCKPSTGPLLQPIVSTITHHLLLEFSYTTFQETEDGSWKEGPRMKQTLKRKTTVGDCSLSRPTVQTPSYVQSMDIPKINPEEYLEPYTESTLPPSFFIPRTSTIFINGVQEGKGRLYPGKYSPAQVRAHQLETGTFCVCFFELAPRLPEQGSGLNLMDTLQLFPKETAESLWESPEWLAKQRVRQEQDWKERHLQRRSHIPGFMYMFAWGCACNYSTSAGPQPKDRLKAGITYRSNAEE